MGCLCDLFHCHIEIKQINIFKVINGRTDIHTGIQTDHIALFTKEIRLKTD